MGALYWTPRQPQAAVHNAYQANDGRLAAWSRGEKAQQGSHAKHTAVAQCLLGSSHYEKYRRFKRHQYLFSQKMAGVPNVDSKMRLEEDETVQNYYLPGYVAAHCQYVMLRLTCSRREIDIAKEAYEEAIKHLEQEFAGDEQALAWIHGHLSLEEICAEARDVENRYNAVGSGKKTFQHYVRRISSFIMFYSQVMDTLAQHHPEYVSLAWGASKFLLMVRDCYRRNMPYFADNVCRASSTMKKCRHIYPKP